MSNIKKVMITRYDARIKKPPYGTIKIDEMLVQKPENDNLGELLYLELYEKCRRRGYAFKFYTTSKDENFDYEVVVI